MLLDTKYQLDIFSQEEISWLDNAITSRVDCTPDRKSADHPTQPNLLYSNHYIWDYHSTENKDIFEILNKKIEQVTGLKSHVTQSYILESFFPFEIHTDLIHSAMGSTLADNKEPAYTILVPLDDYDTHTVVFNEYSENSCELAEFKENYTGELKLRIPKELVLTLTHVHPKDLMYLTLQDVYQWQKGSVIAFDRGHYHCSDNYIKAGVASKRAILLQTEKP